jgi:hypothetical protein
MYMNMQHDFEGQEDGEFGIYKCRKWWKMTGE